MSYWYEKTKEDIYFSDDKTEIYIYLDTNNDGNVYVSVPVKDIECKLKDLKNK